MLLIIYSFVVEILFLSLLKNFISNWEVASIVFIGVHMIFVFLGIGLFTKENRLLLIVAYTVRLVAMFWDIYGRNIFMFVGSGGDSEGFFRSAVYISNDLSLLRGYIYGGLYAKILGVISYITFPDRILLQYLNVILGLSIILIIYKILRNLNIDSKVTKNSIVFMSIFPISIIHSAILLRENIISFFVTLSFYYFIKWFKNKGLYNVFMFMSLLGIASIFHSGVIGIVIGYIFALLFYNHNKNTFVFSFKTILWFIIIVLFGTIIFTQYNDIFLGKFKNVDDVEDIMITASSGRGGSQYLKWLNITSTLQLILFSPIKMLYFLASPLPMGWRGMGDILAFFTDGIFYLYLTIYFIKNLANEDNRDPLIDSIAIMSIGVIFIFGVGISNAGTAMRHRNKIIPMLIILYALIADKLVEQKRETHCIK